VTEQEQERDLPVRAMDRIHPVETAEERLDDPEPGTEYEIESERGSPPEGEHDGEARQTLILAAETCVEGGRPRPQEHWENAQDHEEERAPDRCE